MCANLASLRDAGRFFLSCHDAADRLDMELKQAWRYLRMLRADGLIEWVEAGNKCRASRYWWIAGNGTTALDPGIDPCPYAYCCV